MPNDVNVEEREAAESTPPPRSRTKAKVLLLVILLAAAGGVYAVYAHYRGQVSSDDAQVDGHVDPVAPKISGTITDVLVLDNQSVTAGQVLVRIDPRDYQVKVDTAKAQLAQAQSQLKAAQVAAPWTSETTESGVSGADAQLADATAELDRARLAFEQSSGSDLAYAQAQVLSKQASNDRAQADLSRMKPLADKAEISQLQYDAYVAAAKVAQSDLQASQEKLASARQDAAIKKAALDAAQTRVALAQSQVQASRANRKQVDIRLADVSTAQAAVEQARANLANAELQLSYATIAAPSDGVVTHKSVEVGQVVAPGQGLMAIIPLSGTWVTANFKETQLAGVRPGQRAEIHVDMYGKSVEGKVDSIAGATGARMSLLPPENATGNFVKVVERIPVKILIPDRAGLVLRPGMNVDVTIYTQ
ncbi:MAG TPA: HlyD family secretion protein [Bryobacteraceae bacterium]|nr:HlyD family secretion protein [Bryobacteraceae bacterium]